MKVFVLAVGIPFLGCAGFSGISQSYQAGVAFAQSQNIGVQIKNVNLTTLPGYTSNPSASQYYQNPGAIALNTQTAILKPGAANTILTAYGTRPQYTVNPNDPAIIQSELVQANSAALSNGVSTPGISCIQPSHCTMSKRTQSCVSNRTGVLSCTIIPVVHIIQVPYQTTSTYSGAINPQSPNTGSFYLPESGLITQVSIALNSNNVWYCNTPYGASLNGASLGSNMGSCGYELGQLYFAQSGLAIPVQSNQPLEFTLSGPSNGDWYSSSYTISMSVTHYKPEVQITLQNSCGFVPSFCSQSQSTCLIPGATRIIDGLPVTQSCWETRQDYSCGLSTGDTCQGLQNQGCSELSSTCSMTINGLCLQYQSTYQCQTSECTKTQNICADHPFCVNGGKNCYQDTPMESQDFGKDDAEMAAASGAAGAISGNQSSLLAFSGEPMSCSTAPIGVLNCCANSGWGKGSLLQCSNSEKKLGLARENHTASFVGDYCAHQTLGVCTSQREAYCVFPGILARDVQEQGRVEQLGIGFGDPKSPNCTGLTVQQLQEINFAKIDFSNAIQTIENQANFPNPASVSAAIAQRIKQEMGAPSHV